MDKSTDIFNYIFCRVLCFLLENLNRSLNTILRAVGMEITRAKRIYISIIKISEWLFLFLLSYCVEESVFNRDLETLREVLAKELEKGLEPLACGWCSLSISRSPNLRFVLLFLVGELKHVMFVYIWAPLYLIKNSYVLTVKYHHSIFRWDFCFLDSVRIINDLKSLSTDLSKTGRS